ncbi:MAG: HD domain-containing protein [Lachnospiraceae bacterium]|nr:HD domain-containing protein [Lachnospiraceae bacterium]
MERYQKIAKHKKFKKYIAKIKKLEENRIYCHHDVTHLLDVGRIAYIRALEKHLPLSKDMIYAAALLHDIGKVKQYNKKIPHEIGGLPIAKKVLVDCGYHNEEIAVILEAIRFHRRGMEGGTNLLGQLLYEADKGSRLCMFCEGRKSCNWTKEEKNSRIEY